MRKSDGPLGSRGERSLVVGSWHYKHRSPSHYRMQHRSRILFAKLFLFFLPFFSLLSSIFLALISRIKSKNTCKMQRAFNEPTIQLASEQLLIGYENVTDYISRLQTIACLIPSAVDGRLEFVKGWKINCVVGFIPCPHWHESWQRSPRSWHPTDRHAPSPHQLTPAYGPPDQTCFPLGGRARSHPPSPGGSAPCNHKPNSWRHSPTAQTTC